MRRGFHTNAFVWSGVNDLRSIVDFAVEAGFTCLEVGPGIPLDRNLFLEQGRRIPYSAFIYCRNFLDDDEMAARKEQEELWRRMDFASAVGAKKMVCSTGISKRLSLPDDNGCNPVASEQKVIDFLGKAVEHAKEDDLTLCLENCPMFRNIATSPYMWRRIFTAISDAHLALCYDPGHFVWQFIDVYEPMKEFASRIAHVHLKDTKIDDAKLRDVGILHNTARERGFEANQWWRHTILGDGDIDWARFLDLLLEEPNPLLDVSFEMEDYRYEGDPSKVKQAFMVQSLRLDSLLQTRKEGKK